MSRGHIPFGIKYVFAGRIDRAGYMDGGYLGTPAAGNQDGDAAVWWEGAQTLPMTVPDVTRVAVPFDDSAGVTFDVESDETPSATLTWAVENLDFEAIIQGTSVYELGDWDIGAYQPTGGSQQDMFLLLQQQSKKWYPSNRGLRAWSSIYVPLCSMRPLGRQLASKAFNGLSYSVTTSKASSFLWGEAFGAANITATASPMLSYHHDNPLYFQRFTGDAIETQFNLDFDPIEASVKVWVAGSIETVTTDYTVTTGSTPDVTFEAGSVPADGAKIIVGYEVLESNLVNA